MTAVAALFRKQLTESRWMLGLSALALFWFSWFSVYVTAFGQARMAQAMGKPDFRRGQMEMLRSMGGQEITAGVLEMQFWVHPFFVLPVVLWAIGRGSVAVAGEVERGTMDVLLSRPVSRTKYLGAQVVFAALGLLVLGASPILGNLAGSRFNVVDGSPGVHALLRPAVCLVALGLSIYGYTLFLSSIDLVRWRPNLFGSVVTLAGYVAFVVAIVPAMKDSRWKPW